MCSHLQGNYYHFLCFVFSLDKDSGADRIWLEKGDLWRSRQNSMFSFVNSQQFLDLGSPPLLDYYKSEPAPVGIYVKLLVNSILKMMCIDNL